MVFLSCLDPIASTHLGRLDGQQPVHSAPVDKTSIQTQHLEPRGAFRALADRIRLTTETSLLCISLVGAGEIFHDVGSLAFFDEVSESGTGRVAGARDALGEHVGELRGFVLRRGFGLGSRSGVSFAVGRERDEGDGGSGS